MASFASAATQTSHPLKRTSSQFTDERHRSELKFSTTKLKPLFPKPIVLDEKKRRRERDNWERFHVLLTDPDQSKLGVWFSSVVMLVIVASCITFVLETLPNLQSYRSDCEHCKPLEGRATLDENLVEERKLLADSCVNCQPEPHASFASIETFCVTVFTIEYMLKLCTAWAVPIPKEETRSATKRTLHFILSPLNIIDLVAIFPFYLTLLSIGSGAQFTVIRVIRLFRGFRILKAGALSNWVDLFQRVFVASFSAFLVFLIFSCLGMIVCASIVYYAEVGTWDADTGLYLREQSALWLPPKQSPFTSIPQSFWWVLVTFSTVGYGDMVPETAVGRALGALTMYLGVFLLAMPITIMSINLGDLYDEERTRLERESRIEDNASCLISVVTQRGRKTLLLRRSWNTWRELTSTEKRLEFPQPTIDEVFFVNRKFEMAREAERELAKHGFEMTKQLKSAVIKVVDEEMEKLKQEVMEHMTQQAKELRELVKVIRPSKRFLKGKDDPSVTVSLSPGESFQKRQPASRKRTYKENPWGLVKR